jgi:OmpA-OmpF porin, OOP family
MSGIDFFSAKRSLDWMRTGELQRKLQSTASILQLTGNLFQKLPRTGLYDSSYVKRAAANHQMALDRVRLSDPALGDRLSRRTALAAPRTEKQGSRRIGRLKVRGIVEFAFNSARLSSESQKTLKELAREINSFDPMLEVKIYGHTSRSGDPTWNRLLSQRRAEAAVAQLKSQGIGLKMRAIGLGSDRPLPGLRADDPKNQRTEVILGT